MQGKLLGTHRECNEASCADALRASSRVPSTHMDRGELREESLRGRLV